MDLFLFFKRKGGRAAVFFGGLPYLSFMIILSGSAGWGVDQVRAGRTVRALTRRMSVA